MRTEVFDFFTNHLVLAALLASALWFYGGHEYLAKGKKVTGLAWQFIGVLVLAAFCVNAVASRSWYSLIVAIGTIALEIWLIRRYRRISHPGHS